MSQVYVKYWKIVGVKGKSKSIMDVRKFIYSVIKVDGDPTKLGQCQC